MPLAQQLKVQVENLKGKVKQLVAETAELKQRITELLEKIAEKDRKIAALEDDKKSLLKQQYGPKSDRVNAAAQLLIEGVIKEAESTKPEEEGNDQAGDQKEPARKRKRPKKTRTALRTQFEHLPKKIETIDLPEEEKIDPATGQPLKLIGYEETVRLAEEPAQLYQRVIRRPKYSNPNGIERDEPGVKVAALPDNNPIENCRADVSMLASIITSKYLDHLTLYRLQEHYWRLGGVWIDRKTLCGWVGGCADALEPLWMEMQRQIFASGYVGLDDTILRMLQPEAKAGKTKNVRLWAYVGLLEEAPYTLYDFTLTRKKADRWPLGD